MKKFKIILSLFLCTLISLNSLFSFVQARELKTEKSIDPTSFATSPLIETEAEAENFWWDLSISTLEIFSFFIRPILQGPFGAFTFDGSSAGGPGDMIPNNCLGYFSEAYEWILDLFNETGNDLFACEDIDNCEYICESLAETACEMDEAIGTDAATSILACLFTNDLYGNPQWGCQDYVDQELHIICP